MAIVISYAQAAILQKTGWNDATAASVRWHTKRRPRAGKLESPVSAGAQTTRCTRVKLRTTVVSTGDPLARRKPFVPLRPARAGAEAEALRAAGERAQAVLDSIGDAVISTDLAGRITYMNRSPSA